MNRSEVAYKYSRALFYLAQSANKLEEYVAQLNLVVKLLCKPICLSFLSSAPLDQSKKEEFLRKHLKNGIQEDILSFLILLLVKKRFKFLPEIVKGFKELANEKMGIVKGELLTAVPMGDEIIQQLTKGLTKSTGKKVVISNQVDPTLLGGGILILGNQMVDFSIRSRMNKLKQSLLGRK